MIEAKGLSKDFQSWHKSPGLRGALRSLFFREVSLKPAVVDFDLRLESGEIIGLLGPNGAGKTTLMKMFSGIVQPSRGELKILNHRPFARNHAYLRSIALIMGQKSQMWWDIPAMDSLRLLKAYYEVPDSDFYHRLEELCDILKVDEQLHTPVRKLSLGERMKMELIACLLHRPQMIFLDEPTIGLDIGAQKRIRSFLKAYHERYQPTLILTSHYMADIEALCPRIVLIQEGRKAFDGSTRDFSRLLGDEKHVQITFGKPVDPNHKLLLQYNPRFSSDGLSVELKVPADELHSAGAAIFTEFDIEHFETGKMPVERVMQALINP